MEKEWAFRAQLKDEIYDYEVDFGRSAILLIREKHPKIDFPFLRSAKVPNLDDGEGIGNQFEEVEPEVTMDDLFNQ